MMSGCNDPSAEEGTALSRSATRKKAFVTPLAAALAYISTSSLSSSALLARMLNNKTKRNEEAVLICYKM